MTDSGWGLLTRNNGPIPLTGVHVDGQITGRSAKVKVRQRYVNREDKAVEAVYKFPLPEQASICGFRALIGDKSLEGEIEEREKAFKLYDEALERGDGAYLLDEERPNIFTLSVGALPPRGSAIIEIEYVTLLDATDTEVRFFLPTTISPRYVPADTPDAGGIPVDAIVNPPLGLDVPYGLKIGLVIQGREHIAGIESPSHTIATRFEDDHVTVELSAQETKMDRDFVLAIRYRDAFRNRAYISRGKEETYIQVDLSPEKEAQRASGAGSPDGRNEVIFVLDCSGSMNGSSIREAKQALLILLKALRDGTDFNVYRFGSTFEKLFQASVPYSHETFQNAERYVSGISADLGGTEMLQPLRDIYQTRAQETRNVVLITDGEVGNEGGIFDLARSQAGVTRIFTIGIGHGPNEYLIRQLARASGGSSEFVSPGERVEPKVLRLYGRITSATISDLKIHWPGRALQAPAAPPVYAGTTVSVFGKLKDPGAVPDTLRITASVGSTPREWVLDSAPLIDGSGSIPCLWARERIHDLEEGAPGTGSRQKERTANLLCREIVNLSKSYGIVSRETSFVIVEKRLGGERTTGEIALRKVPIMLTKDWGELPTMPPVSFGRFSRKDHAQYQRSFQALDAMDLAAPVSSFELFSPASYHERAPDNRDDELLYGLLNAQRREGGFEVASAVFYGAGLSDDEFREIASKIKTEEETDVFVLLATAVTFQLLRKRFVDRRREWEMVVEKSMVWLNQEIRRVKPTIDGIPLEAWLMENVSV
jgi:Ca-activated chloride channel homolog